MTDDTTTNPTDGALRVLRGTIAAKHNIAPEDHDILTGTDADTIERQAARLAEIRGIKPKPSNYAAKEGSTPETPKHGDDGDFRDRIIRQTDAF